MRLSLKRHLKFLIYVTAVLFFLSLIQKRSEYVNKEEETGNEDEKSNLDKALMGKMMKELVIKEMEVEKDKADADDDDDDDDDDEDDDDVEYGKGEEEDEEEDAGPGLHNLKSFPVADHDLKVPEVHIREDANREVAGDFFMEREQVYRDRRKHIQRMCDALGPAGSYGSMENVPLRRLRWLNEKKLIMCFNAKVGTSTWTQYLLEAGFPGILKKVSHWHYTAERLLKPPNRRASQKSLDLMKQYTKVILVRDPFARIVSAYLDKIARMKFAKLCHFIVDRYRGKDSGVKQRNPTFEEFVRFLVEYTPPDDDIKVKRNHRSDRHWFHYYANCAPCDIHYDIIATMESVHEDTKYIIEKYNLGLPDNIWNNHQAKSSSEETAIQLFHELPRNLTLALYQRYQIDFQMFHYDIERYLPT